VSGSPTYVFDRFRLQASRHELSRDGRPLPLEPKAFAVLSELIAHDGELLEHDRLLDAVWGHRHVTPGVLTRSIAQLRRALGDDSEHPRYIQTVHALGYRFIAPVKLLDVAPDPSPQPEVADTPAQFVPTAFTSRGAIPLAVLPFANMSEDPGQAYFSEGISEDLITELSRWRMLAVRSHTASFRYRGTELDIRQVAHELQVRFVVEGSVRRAGDHVRITAQLIDAETGNHVWAEKFDRVLADIFAVQDEVVRTVVSTLVGRMQAAGIERARRKPPSDLAAYECVLKGNALRWDDPGERVEASRLFEQAIALDPGYGFAHALLAAMRYGDWYEAPIGDDIALDHAFALAMRGVELDPDESTCHSILAQVHHLRREFDLCLQHIQRSVELNPCNQWNIADMGMMLNYAGRAEEALAWFQCALEMDPYFDEPWYWREYGIALLLRQRYAEAVKMFNRLSVRHYRIAALRAAAHALLGDDEHARLDAVECLAQCPDFNVRHFMAKFPFREPADARLLAKGMRAAGLPD